MRSVRHSLFETNSSSMHYDVIDGDDEYTLKKFNHVNLDKFGLSYDEDDLLKTPWQKLSYLFTYAICRLMTYDNR